MKDLEPDDEPQWAYSRKFIVPARRAHCFGLLIFEKTNGANAEYTQVVNENGLVAGFERFASNKDIETRIFEDVVKVAVGEPPKIVFVLDKDTSLCGTQEELRDDLADVLTSLGDEPLIALSVAKMCTDVRQVKSYTVKAFDHICSHASRSAAEIWRDQLVILPIVRDEIRKMMSSSYEKEVLRGLLDNIMYSNGRVMLERKSDFVFNDLGQRLISEKVVKRIPKQFGIKKLKFVNSFVNLNVDVDWRERVHVETEIYGPFYILGSKGFKLNRVGRARKAKLLFKINSEERQPHTTVHNGKLPREGSGLEFYTSSRPSSDPASETVEWVPEEDNLVDIEIQRGQRFASIAITISSLRGKKA